MKGRYRSIVGVVMRQYTILFILTVIIISSCTSDRAVAGGLNVVCDTLFETKPGESPYYLPLGTAFMGVADFTPAHGGPESPIDCTKYFGTYYRPASLGYFWALNNDEMVFINRQENNIYIINMLTGDRDIFKPKVGEYNRVSMIWVGPQDEIYAILSPSSGSDRIYYDFYHSKYRLFRFERYNGKYSYDDKSVFPENVGYPRQIRVSPLDNLYIQGWRGSPKFRGKNLVFNKYGQEISGSDADGENLIGQEFIVEGSSDRNGRVVRARGLKSKSFFMIQQVEHFPYIDNFKYTFNDNLILYNHHQTEIRLPNDKIMQVDMPSIIGVDVSSGYHYTIETYTLAREDYRYYSISDVSINYDGEIYVLAVYFDEPGFITGDELIVMYRFKAVSEF